MREMRANGRPLAIWCAGVFVLVAGGMAKYAGYSSAGQSVNELMKQMPRIMQSIMGMGAVDLSTVMGFFSILYLYLLIMAGVHAGLLGAEIIAKEEEYKTVEFLFVKPVSRRWILAAKILAALANILILNLAAWLSSEIFTGYYSRGADASAGLKILMGGLFFFQLFFLATGTVLSAVKKRPRNASSVCAGILLGTFILSAIIDISGRLNSLKYFTPFKYFEAGTLLARGGLPGGYVILSISVTALLFILSFVFYSKKDLTI